VNRLFRHFILCIVTVIFTIYFGLYANSYVTLGDGKIYTLDKLDSMTDEISKTGTNSYLISSSLIIANENAPDVLQIDAGTILSFEKGCFLRIDGAIIAMGELNKPIVFTSAAEPKNYGDWAGISFSPSCAGDRCILEYCQFEFATVGIRCEKSSILISNCQIIYSSFHALAFHSSSSTVTKCSLSSKGFCVVWCVSSEVNLLDNRIFAAQNSIGIKLESSNATVSDNSIENGVHGIYCFRSSPKIKNNHINNSQKGISSINSKPVIIKNRIENCEKGIDANFSKITARENDISDSSEAGIYVIKSVEESKLTKNKIKRSKIGIYCEKSNVKIADNSIRITDYGIYCKSCQSNIFLNVLDKCDKSGITMLSDSDGKIETNKISNSYAGIYCHRSFPVITNNEIRDGEFGIECEPLVQGIDNNLVKNISHTDQRFKLDDQKSESEKQLVRIKSSKDREDKETPEVSLKTEGEYTKSKDDKIVNRQSLDNKQTEAIPEKQVPKLSNQSRKQSKKEQKFSQEQRTQLKNLQNKLEEKKLSKSEKIKVKFQVGRMYFQSGEFEKALKSYDDIVKEFEQLPKKLSENKSEYEQGLANLHYHRALCFYQLHRYDEAISASNKCLKMNPEDQVMVHVQYILGMSYMQINSLAHAEDAFLAVLQNKDSITKNSEDIPANTLFQLARIKEKTKDYLAAMEMYKNGLDEANDLVLKMQIASALGYCCVRNQDYDSALDFYKKVIEYYSGNREDLLAEAYHAMGDIYARKKSWQEAQNCYTQAMNNSNSVMDANIKGEIQFKLAESLFFDGKKDKAVEFYKEALQLSPNAKWKADALYQIAEAQFRSGKYSDAIDSYKNLIEADKDNPNIKIAKERSITARYKIAQSFEKLAEFESGEASKENYLNAMQAYKDTYKACSSIDDNKLRLDFWKDSLYGEAICAKKLSKTDIVESAAQKFADICQNDVNGLLQASDLFFDIQKYDKAKIYYEKALFVLNTDSIPINSKANALVRLGQCYSVQGLKQKAIEAYDNAISEMENDENMTLDLEEILCNAKYQKALIHKEIGEYEKADILLNDVFEKDKSKLRDASKVVLADVYEKQGKFSSAIQMYESIVNEPSELYEYKDINYALFRLAEINREQEKYEKALQYYKDLLNRNIEDKDLQVSANYFAAWCYSKLETPNNHEAINLYNNVVNKYPESELTPDAYFNMAQLHVDSGDDEQALSTYQTIIEKYELSEDEHKQKIVNSTRNSMSNILMKNLEIDPEKTKLLSNQLQKIIQSENSTSEQRANAYFELGNISFRDGEYRKAIAHYDNAKSESLTEEISNAIDYQKAISLFRLGDYVSAIEAGNLALTHKQSPDVELQLYYILGQSELKMDRLDEAEKSFNAVLTKVNEIGNVDPEIIANSYLYLGYILSKTEREEDSLDKYLKTVENASKDSTKAEAYLRMAKIYEKQGKEDKVIDTYNRLLEIGELGEEIKAEALYRRGYTYQNSDSSKALEDFRSLTGEYSDSKAETVRTIVGDAELRLLNLYAKDENIDEGIEAGERALKYVMKKDDKILMMQVQYQLASLYQEKAKLVQQGKQSQSYVNKAFELYTTIYEEFERQQTEDKKTLASKSLFQAGQLAYQSGNFNLAIQPLETFVKQFPEDKKSLIANEYLAWSYFNNGEELSRSNEKIDYYAKASIQFEKLASNYPEEIHAPEWWYQAAQSANSAKDISRSIAMYRKLTAAYPSHELADDAMYAIGSALTDKKDYNSAIDEYEKLIGNYPESDYIDDATYSVGTCYDELNNHPKAVETYNIVMQNYPESPLAAYSQANIGHYYFNNKNYKKALEEYKKLNEKNFPGIETELLAKAKQWRHDTESRLAEPLYKEALNALEKAESETDKTEEYAQKSISLFKQIIDNYPKSMYIKHAIVSLGTAYELVEQWNKALEAYQKFLDDNKNTQDDRLAKYAFERSEAIKIFLWQKQKFEGN